METNVATRGGSVLKSYRHTLYASYLGYITQAIVNTFVPLLFTPFIAVSYTHLGRRAFQPDPAEAGRD